MLYVQVGSHRLVCLLMRGVRATQVLVSSGAFTNFRKLLPDGEGSHAALDLQLLTAQTVKVQLNEHDARRLESMPSVIFKGMYDTVIPMHKQEELE